MMEINVGAIAAIGAFVVLLTTFGTKIKSFLDSLQRFWLKKIILDKQLSGAVFYYCMNTKRLSRWRAKTYFACQAVVKGREDETTLAMDILSQSTTVFWDGWKPIIISPGKWVCNPTTFSYERTTHLYLPRFFWKADDFIKCSLDHFDRKNKKKQGRFSITNFHGKNKKAPTITLDDTKRSDHKLDSLQEAKSGRAKLVHMKLSDLVDPSDHPFDWYAFPPKVMESVSRARRWHESQGWYRSKKIPWRRGWIVHGKPGSGKTLLLKCLAQDLGLPVYSFDLPSMSNEEFVSFWSEAMSSSPCMILFEDFDAVFHGRESVTNEDLTFDCILNCISGIDQADGLFLGMTANDIQQIDTAMGIADSCGSSSRPGRIDEVIQLNTMDEDCRRKTAMNILDTQNMDEIVQNGKGMTAAQFVESCNGIALALVKPVKQVKQALTLKDINLNKRKPKGRCRERNTPTEILEALLSK